MNNQQPPDLTNPTHTSFFENAAGFTLNNPIFMDIGSTQYPRPRRTGESPCPAIKPWLEADVYDEGLGRLYESSLPDAIHGSAARQFAAVAPPTPEHTRIIEALSTHFIQSRTSSLLPNLVVLNGPKSNLAQICAEKLEEFSCATFFVSKQFGTDDPAKLFPTIAYQLASDPLFSRYASLLELKLRRKPSLLRMSLELQFKELIAEPFRQLLSDQGANDACSRRRVIVVDGLDEYSEPLALPTILQMIPKNAANLPFVWLLSTQSDVDSILDSRSTTGEGRTAKVTFFDGDERASIAFPKESVCAVVSLQSQHRIAAVPLQPPHRTAVQLYCFFDSCTVRSAISISFFFF
jgi:hypothetical protein